MSCKTLKVGTSDSKGSGSLDIPAGGSHELKLGWTGPLDGDHYLARMLIWQAGQVVAEAGSVVLVTEGEVSAVSVPELLISGEEGTFAVTFHNLASSATAVLGQPWPSTIRMEGWRLSCRRRWSLWLVAPAPLSVSSGRLSGAATIQHRS